MPDARVVRVDNLFNPLLPLTDPDRLVARGLAQDRLQRRRRGLSRVARLGRRGAAWSRDHDRVVLRQGGSKSGIAALSDGYQSMLVLALGHDAHRARPSGAALPWLKESCSSTNSARTCIRGGGCGWSPALRGADAAGAVHRHDPRPVVPARRTRRGGRRRPAKRSGDVVAIADLPPVAGMRVDQLLTSEHFGLGSTDDPELDGLWSEYYRLEGRRVTRPRSATSTRYAQARPARTARNHRA